MAGATASLDSLPWITKDGYLDMLKVPLESTYSRVCEGNPPAARDALGVLACAAGYGRCEAALLLLGFFVALPPEDWALRSEVVEALRHVRTRACVSLLLAELGRVESTNSTRRYLDRILAALSAFPAELVGEQLEALARDRRFSPRMRAKLRACGFEAERHGRGGSAGLTPVVCAGA